ncbi:Aminopeptidase N precursor [Sarcoptes scabiei]|nr:Aminopeptidase N precursor [Sarcoptes scabiei]
MVIENYSRYLIYSAMRGEKTHFLLSLPFKHTDLKVLSSCRRSATNHTCHYVNFVLLSICIDFNANALKFLNQFFNLTNLLNNLNRINSVRLILIGLDHNHNLMSLYDNFEDILRISIFGVFISKLNNTTRKHNFAKQIHQFKQPPILNAHQQKTEIEEDVNKIHDDDTVDKEIDDLGLEYGRYLQEIVKVLDEDPVFAKKLENVTHEQIMSGHVAGIIDQVAPEIRSRLDELKRVEMERLRKLLAREHKLEEEMEDEQHRQKIGDGSYDLESGRRWRTVISHNKLPTLPKLDDSVAAHIDHSNPHSFEAEDLQKLILKATKDLDELDKKRRRDFKQYEMEKEIQYQESLQNMTAEQKAEAIKHHDEIKKKHSEHPKVHHPGSKQQLEEVWEEQDHLPKQEFDPKVFYQMHDINGDGFLDQEEVEALLGLEVKKLYNEKDSTYDRNEMMEEYHRMREQMYQEIDANHDGLISRKEFLDYTKNEDFNKDEEWKGIEEEPVYTPEELKRYEQERRQLQEHYARYGAYQQQHQYQVDPAHGPYQNVYYQQVPVQQHPGQQHPQEVYVVQHPPQHVQSVQYHHLELPPQHIQQQQVSIFLGHE